MTSQINFNIIDGTYPVAGQDNSSQGFRDNFTNIKNNFESAYDEITDLQNKVLLSRPLSNGIFNNDLQGNIITNAQLQGMRETYFNIGNTSGVIKVDFNVGTFQTMTLTGSTTISEFSSFSSTNGSFAKIGLQITTANSSYTVTMPSTVTRAYDIAGYNTSTRVLTFDGPGTYTYEIGTVDGGTSFYLLDVSGNKTRVMGGNLVITTDVGGAATTGITMTVTNIGGIAIGNITANNFIGNTIISGGEDASFTGNVTADWFIANSAYVGQLATNTQPNITLVGTLTSLSVSGNANVGNLTVNGITDLCGGDAYGVQLLTAVDGGTSILSNAAGFALINPTDTISSHSVVMPQNPMQGQVIRISFANTITTITHSGYGTDTVHGNLSSPVNANVGGSWIYYISSEINSGNGAWYRVG